MRVISGSARGLKLKAPEGMNTRPTTDRIKESLFNIIAAELYDICFADLFAGSGAIGIEALSRGAKKAYFSDSNRKSAEIIKDNLSRARLADKAEVFCCDYSQALSRIKANDDKIDIAFLDPPYNKGLAVRALEEIVRLELLSDDGFIIVEQAAEEPAIDVAGLKTTRVKDYKTTKMTYLCKEI
ncbi:MAG: 16S rRNA (guanine(966)-N(2))-methyltransferase RsmD [Firmicutes bacterium]|nr:16S rRNA (guanine(966)-N(2))-methyltransferase RsmD [Bacillota bacterium]